MAAWAFLIEPRRLVVRRAEIESARWPADRPPLRIALVSDLHAGGPHVKPPTVARLVERVNDERPDLVLLLGDYVDHRVALAGHVDPEAVAAALGGLRAPLGVLAVLGNHDWGFGGDRVRAALTEAGIRVLENEATAISMPSGRIWVAGVADARMRRADPRAALREVPDGEPVIFLTHDPDVFPHVPDRVALTVGGHMHGGQVGIPRLRRRLVPSRYGERFVGGHVEEDGRHLYVTKGVGEAGLPMRFLAPPEVVLVTLRSA